MSKPLAFICLSISIASLALAVSVHWRADAVADAALSRRERALVEKLKPKVMQVIADFNVENNLKDVTTLDGLFAPLFHLSTGIK